MNTEFLGLGSVPSMTSHKNLCDPWITSVLDPFGSFTNSSKHELFGRESGEISMIKQKIDGDQGRQVCQ